jgi:hypothetical protein
MEEKNQLFLLFLVGDRPYLHEGQKISNLKDI